MQIALEENDTHGRFYIRQEGDLLAEMTFLKTDIRTITIDHTEVSDVLRGTGAGKKLIAAAVDYARLRGYKIIPLCPFAKAVFDKTPEYVDVLL